MKNKKLLILACILILLPSVIITAVDSVFDTVLSGTPLCVLALVMVVMQIICVLFTERDNRKGQSAKVMKMVYFILPVINLFLCGIITSISLGMDFDIYKITYLMICISFIISGNYIPKCRRNRTIGIKIKWTLENDENWNATHRFGGKMWFIGGVILLFGIFLPAKITGIVMFASFILFAFSPMIYSYVFYKKSVKDGSFRKDESLKTEVSKKAKTVSVVLVSVILAAVVSLMVTGDISVSLYEESFTVKSTYWSNITISYDEIDSVTYAENVRADVREFGWGSAKLRLGSFRNDELGSYTRCTYVKCTSAVIVRTDSQIYMIGLKDDSETMRLYEQLIIKSERSADE